LKDLYEIEESISYFNNYEDYDDIGNFVTMNRKYISRWSPLNLDLISPFEVMENPIGEESPNAIFDLPASAYALVTLDFRHVRDEFYNFTYGEDWAISFTLKPELEIDSQAEPSEMPEQFLSNLTIKN